MGLATAIVLGWCAAVGSVASWATFRSWRRRRAVERHALPLGRGALMVRPCAGDEPNLFEALRSTSRATRSFQLALRVAIESEDDEAAPAARRACVELSRDGLDARVVVTGARGPNRKVDQIARVLAAESSCPPLLIIADSDVDLSHARLDDLVARLDVAEVGAVWAAPIEVHTEGRTLADRASAAVLDSSLHSFALLASLDPYGMVGKLFAIQMSTLVRVGGMRSLVGHLGEDMELARRLRGLGLRVELATAPARSVVHGRSLRDVTRRYARWIGVIRAQRTRLLGSYPLLFAATPLIACASFVAAVIDGPSALAVAALAVTVRIGTAWAARAASDPASRRKVTLASLVTDAALADAVLLAGFVLSLATRRVSWRGASLTLTRTGEIRENAR